MAKIYNKIVESTTEPSKEDLWLKEGKIKKFKNGWEDISGKSDVKIPTKVSELENDSRFVESTSLGTAAYKNVEDLQGGWQFVKTLVDFDTDPQTIVTLPTGWNEDSNGNEYSHMLLKWEVSGQYTSFPVYCDEGGLVFGCQHIEIENYCGINKILNLKASKDIIPLEGGDAIEVNVGYFNALFSDYDYTGMSIYSSKGISGSALTGRIDLYVKK